MKLNDKQREILRSIGDVSLNWLACVLCNSLRIRRINSEGIDSLIKKNENFILAFWHGTMLIPWFIHKNRNFAGLVSKSKDGGLLANLLEKWNYKVIRGSSNDGGRAALNAMIDLAKNNNTLCLTPDGPRGPIYKFKAGAVVTSVKTGIPLVLCGVHYSKALYLKSWDRFGIPWLFSKVKVIYSKPLYFDSELTRDKISQIIIECEDEMNKMQLEAGVN